MPKPLDDLDALQARIRLDSMHRYMVYRKDDGKWVSYSGVTSVMGDTLAKPALVQWAANQEREHDLNIAYQNPAQPGEEFKVYARRFNAVAGKAGAYRRTSDTAAARGHVVHAALEALMLKRLGMPYSVPEMTDQERQMVGAFVTWEKDHPIEPIRAENKICNDELWYAGTFDLLCKVDGKLVLADFKTGKASDRTYPEHSLQSAAYRQALQDFGFPKMRGMIIQVDREGGPCRSHWLEDDIGPAFETFKALLGVRRYLNNRDQYLPPPD